MLYPPENPRGGYRITHPSSNGYNVPVPYVIKLWANIEKVHLPHPISPCILLHINPLRIGGVIYLIHYYPVKLLYSC